VISTWIQNIQSFDPYYGSCSPIVRAGVSDLLDVRLDNERLQAGVSTELRVTVYGFRVERRQKSFTSKVSERNVTLNGEP